MFSQIMAIVRRQITDLISTEMLKMRVSCLKWINRTLLGLTVCNFLSKVPFPGKPFFTFTSTFQLVLLPNPITQLLQTSIELPETC